MNICYFSETMTMKTFCDWSAMLERQIRNYKLHPDSLLLIKIFISLKDFRISRPKPKTPQRIWRIYTPTTCIIISALKWHITKSITVFRTMALQISWTRLILFFSQTLLRRPIRLQYVPQPFLIISSLNLLQYLLGPRRPNQL